MKPVSYQSGPSSVNVGHPGAALERVLNSSNVMYCDKCGFASADAAAFKKHRIEHMGTRFYCFYCNNVFLNEAELHAHIKSHTAKYPFTCPHCGQGYMRRLCLVKHIERLHGKSTSQIAAKHGADKTPLVAVSSASTSVLASTASSSTRPLVRVKVPTLSAPAVRLGKDQQRGKTLDTNTSKSKVELIPPLNGLIQQNRALTVPLPEELNIPAGCMVELVEVKTVNGTKELKLRLVSSENESVIKDTRTSGFDSNALGKPLSSTSNHPAKSVSLGTYPGSRKPHEMKNGDSELPAVVPINIYRNLPSQGSKDNNGLKRTSHEIIDLVGNSVIPNKVSKSIFSPIREGTNGIKFPQRETVNHNPPPPSITSASLPNRLTGNLHPENRAACVSQRAADQRSNSNPQPVKCAPIRRTNDAKSVNKSMSVKLDPRVNPNNNNSALTLRKREGGSNQQTSKSPSSMCVSSVSALQVRPPKISLPPEKVCHQSFSAARVKAEPSSAKTPALSNGNDSQISAWKHEVRLKQRYEEKKTPEPESFPVISSVFSLSQHTADVQGSIQPMVMAALRGIVMDKNSCCDKDNIKESKGSVKELPPLNHCVQGTLKDEPITQNLLSTCQQSRSVKVEEPDKDIRSNHIPVKQENKSTLIPENDKQSLTLDVKPSITESANVPEASRTVEQKSENNPEASRTEEPRQEVENPLQKVSSKFLTVSLKRLQVGVWKQRKKGLKLRISKCKTQGTSQRHEWLLGFLPGAAEGRPAGEATRTEPARGGAKPPEARGLPDVSGERGHFSQHGRCWGGSKVPNLKNETQQSGGAEV